ncbi:MAG: hypothetical protein ACPG4N_06080 [Gammaproteobacteria bacterium]
MQQRHALCRLSFFLALSLVTFSPQAYDVLDDLQGGGNDQPPAPAQSAEQLMQNTLQQGGLSNEQAGQIIDGVQTRTSIDLSGPMHDRVDFSRFPNARINTAPLPAKAALVIPPALAGYVFTGKPDSFQGSFRTYEFHIGRGMVHAAGMIFGQMFDSLRQVSSPAEADPDEVIILPTLEQFSFTWGGTWTPKMYVSLSTSVQMLMAGRNLYQGTFPVRDIQEDGQSLFPTEDQEHRAISTALIESLKQSAGPIAGLRSQLAPPPPVASQSTAPASQTPTPVTDNRPEILDMGAVGVLASTWRDYHTNKHRLSHIERVAAVRILQIKDAYEVRDETKQAEALAELRKIARERNLEPTSREELIEDIKRLQTDREIQTNADIAWDDKIYNFAGDNTDTVLEYTGLGIDLAKTAVVVAGCAGSGGTLCPALVSIGAAFEPAGTIAEGIGAGTAKLGAGGSGGEAMFDAAKAMVIDIGAGAIGKAGGKLLGEAVTHRIARNTTKQLTSELPENLVKRGNQAIYVAVREELEQASSSLSGYAENLIKQVSKEVESAGEKVLSANRAANKAIQAKGGPKPVPTLHLQAF